MFPRHYHHDIVKPERVTELIVRVQERSAGRLDTARGRLLVSVSTVGGMNLPPDDAIAAGDYVLLHGNSVGGRGDPDRIRESVDRVRRNTSYRDVPILFNEDDHFDFDQPDNNFLAALSAGAGWEYFDHRFDGEGFPDGYQSVPVDWGINSVGKRAFFNLLAEVSGLSPKRES